MANGAGGRPALYEPSMCEQVKEWYGEGMPCHAIADKLGIAECTLYEWKNKYPEFGEAFKKGKKRIVGNVVGAMYKRAMGYDAEETTIERKWDAAKQEYIEIPTKVTRKHVAADTTAQQVLLYNLDPENFQRNRQSPSQPYIMAQNVNVLALKADLAKIVDEIQSLESSMKPEEVKALREGIEIDDD